MKQLTRLMIDEFKIKQLGYDFMGYSLQKGDIHTFHHLIIPRRKDGPYERWNGAILCGQTSHPYLHIIEGRDEEIFALITSEMIDMNIKGRLDIDNIKNIQGLLSYFEREHINDKTAKGKILIKDKFKERIKF